MSRQDIRVCAAVPHSRVADVAGNLRAIEMLWAEAHDAGAALVVFPELCLCGYTVRDLMHDPELLAACENALITLAQTSKTLAPMVVVGLPLRTSRGVFNVAAAVQGGDILGVVPKSYLPNYREFEECRWFRSGREIAPGALVTINEAQVPMGTDVIFRSKEFRDLVVGIELCEDFWVPQPPSMTQVMNGATIICNLSASNFVVGKAELRRLLAQSISDRGKCGYLYVAAGPGESSTDLAFDADAFICENGRLLAESERFARKGQLVCTDLDLEGLVHARSIYTSFADCAAQNRRSFRSIQFSAQAAPWPLMRPINPPPFLPDDSATLTKRCWEVFEIQSNALATRMAALGKPKLILGVSGGLDSTHAALVAIQGLLLNNQSPKDLVCVTMPGLGTSSATRENAEALCFQLGAQFEEVALDRESLNILAAIGHPAALGAKTSEDLVERLRRSPEQSDITVENVQARLRTLVLMSIANRDGGLVVGTGDLSEKALGWSTYAGDQISMYDVNAGVPKTLIQFVIHWVADARIEAWAPRDAQSLRETLLNILDTPISPELLPADESGQISQLTEETIGPYELHDFFLYHFVRRGRRPARILDLATLAFVNQYDHETLKTWLRVFLTRFFAYQFKRSCTPDGPKVGMVSLSPRGDWRMPSDASAQLWLEAVEQWTPPQPTALASDK